MILLIDNYDSFSYNLVQMIGEINPDIQVVRNDEVTLEQIDELDPSHIILSPGPGRPNDAGMCEKIVQNFGSRYPILGVCLGHQAITEAFGASIDLAEKLMHGKKSDIILVGNNLLFEGLSQTIEGARYHSLITRAETIPDELQVIASSEQGEVMAVAHKEYPIYGLQFHPESILTPEGSIIINNFLAI